MRKLCFRILVLSLLLCLLMPAAAFATNYFVGAHQTIGSLIAVKGDIQGDYFTGGYPRLITNPAFSCAWVMLANTSNNYFGQVGWIKRIGIGVPGLFTFAGWIDNGGSYQEARWTAPVSSSPITYEVRWLNNKYYFYQNGYFLGAKGPYDATTHVPQDAQVFGETAVDSQPRTPGETNDYVFFDNVYLDIKLGYWSLANLSKAPADSGLQSWQGRYWVNNHNFGVYDTRETR